MAAQITHIVYGRKVFERQKGLLWNEFVIGTLFPDIRYLAKIDRNSTHVFHTSEEEIPKNDSFSAGKYVHCLIDEKREAFLRESGMYDLIFHETLPITAIKLLEDFLVYEEFNGWNEVIVALNTFPTKELSFGVEREKLVEWYSLLQEYFSQKPTIETCKRQILKIGFDEKVALAVLTMVSEYQKNEKIVKIIKETYKAI